MLLTGADCISWYDTRSEDANMHEHCACKDLQTDLNFRFYLCQVIVLSLAHSTNKLGSSSVLYLVVPKARSSLSEFNPEVLLSYRSESRTGLL